MSDRIERPDPAVGHESAAPQPGSREQWLTVAEVAAILRFTERHVRRLYKLKILKAHHFGKAVRIARSDLDEYIARNLIRSLKV